MARKSLFEEVNPMIDISFYDKKKPLLYNKQKDLLPSHFSVSIMSLLGKKCLNNVKIIVKNLI